MKPYVIITGGYGGLGKALANEFAKNNFGLILLGRKKKKLLKIQTKLASKTDVKIVVCDIINWSDCKKAFNQIKKEELNCKILINNAGITYIKKFDKKYSIKTYKKVIDTNLNGSVYLTKLFLSDILKNKGSIITISSVLGYAPLLGRTAYVASKFGLEGFYSVLDAELHKKVHILMVYPTFIATNIRKKIKGDKTINEVLKPNQVAKKIFKAYKKKKSKIYIGKTAKLIRYLYKYFPNLYVNLMRRKACL